MIEPLADGVDELGLVETDVVTSVSFQIADERLKTELPEKHLPAGHPNRYGGPAARESK
ncbi:hypothetical protein PPMP20_24060 [Paraburkholderia phymatum]|uniref:hypothetical protein n=1 Tax=Paraburkholderia phymatum TaxID=148447 RepID=UPI0002FEB9F7|nr:hypothetical protein [Paraburkholderia phymatum]